MLATLMEKEIRDLLGSVKFAIAFSVCAVLILLSFFTGAQNYTIAQRQYEAAKAENLHQLDGMTDWLMLRQNRIFLPPEPVAAIVTGVSNDIGRTVEVSGRGELVSQDSRFEDEPLFAVFRFLDLEFVFGVVLSLLAILLGYDAICGEKERGTLRLVFSHAVPRATYILGKAIGSVAALLPALLIPLLTGCLLLIVMGIPMQGDDWVRLAMVIVSGLVFFTVMLMIAIFVSALTHRSSSAFLSLLVIWVLTVFVVPRAAVLLAGRAVEVPSADEIAAQKSAYGAELWAAGREKLSNFAPSKTGDMEAMMKEFQDMMEKQADERDEKMQQLAGQLNESRANRQRIQQGWAFGLSRLSPLASFSLTAMTLAGTDLRMRDRFQDEAKEYQTDYAKFMKAKTGMVPGRGMVIMRVNEDSREKPKPVDPKELPEFHFARSSTVEATAASLPNLGLLVLWGLGAFAGAFGAFLKYDLR
jgi:ABC-type transport system involved in multi-copper enzyme maturation permease subunit